MPEVITTKNTPAFAALLRLDDNCAVSITKFARKYAGEKVEFDGSILNVQPHGSYDTRFDFLIGPGDFDSDSQHGPTFQYANYNVFDLNLTGKHIPDSVAAGQNYRFTAEVNDYNPDTCLFHLTPKETRVR